MVQSLFIKQIGKNEILIFIDYMWLVEGQFSSWLEKKNQIGSTVPYKTYVLKSCNLRSTKTCASFDWLILFWNYSLDNEILNTVGIYCLIDILSTMSYVNFNCSTIACQKQILYMVFFKPCVIFVLLHLATVSPRI